MLQLKGFRNRVKFIEINGQRRAAFRQRRSLEARQALIGWEAPFVLSILSVQAFSAHPDGIC